MEASNKSLTPREKSTDKENNKVSLRISHIMLLKLMPVLILYIYTVFNNTVLQLYTCKMCLIQVNFFLKFY